MGRRILNLKYAAVCRDCGAALAVGDQARYYGRGRVYGVHCHPQKPVRLTGEQRARQEIAAGTDAFMKAHGQSAWHPQSSAPAPGVKPAIRDNVVKMTWPTGPDDIDAIAQESQAQQDETDDEADPADCFDAGDFDDDQFDGELPL